jgi:hypothetical protein
MTIDYLENYSIKIGHICLANWMYGWKKYSLCTQRENIFPHFVRKVLRRRKIAQKYFLCVERKELIRALPCQATAHWGLHNSRSHSNPL